MTFDPNFPQTGSVPPGGFIIQAELKSAFDVTAGHSHDGVDSKALAITKAQLASATQSAHIADAAVAAVTAPTKAEYDALVGAFNALLVACEKLFLATS